jgi:predicted RNA-binding Zn-ribbon protein involved in translation (DUF1610 family)
MKIEKAIELMKQYSECPQCGNISLGKNQGKLEVTENSFLRSCNCGFKVEIKEK